MEGDRPGPYLLCSRDLSEFPPNTKSPILTALMSSRNDYIQHELAVRGKGRFVDRCATQLQGFLLYKDKSAPPGLGSPKGRAASGVPLDFRRFMHMDRLRLSEQSHIVSASTLVRPRPGTGNAESLQTLESTLLSTAALEVNVVNLCVLVGAVVRCNRLR
jgi:hypothetical protein